MASGGDGARLGYLGAAAVRNGDGPRRRWRWPKRARGGRPAGSEPVLEVRASPEMRPGSHVTGPQPPKRASVIYKDAGECPDGCLP